MPNQDRRPPDPRGHDHGQGQSGYAAGRRADDPALRGQQRDAPDASAGAPPDDADGLGLDDRFTGRPGTRRPRASPPPTPAPSDPRAEPADRVAAEGYGAQGPGQGHTGGEAAGPPPSPPGGYASGRWGAGHQGADRAIGGHDVEPDADPDAPEEPRADDTETHRA